MCSSFLFAIVTCLCIFTFVSSSAAFRLPFSKVSNSEQQLGFDPPTSAITALNNLDDESAISPSIARDFGAAGDVANGNVLTLNKLFSSDMVLQRGPKQSSLWGEGVPGSAITVSVDGSNVGDATADGAGYWRVVLMAQPILLNSTLLVSDGTTNIKLSNVAFGDVYLCSGQSNMVLTLNYTWGGPEKLSQWASYPYIRLYNIPPQYSLTPQNQSTTTWPGWVTVTPATLSAYPGDYSNWFSATCFWAASAVYDSLRGKVPLGLVQASYGGTCIEAWTSPDSNSVCGPYVIVPPWNNQPYNQASVLYNSMIHPLLGVSLTGVFWYQGESNWINLDRYYCAFPNMILDWRKKFDSPDLPFFFVLLAAYASGGASLPPLRLAQLSGLSVPHTGVSNAIDLGDEQSARGDIHPRNKSYVGHRLALQARQQIYGETDLVTSGPQIATATATLIGNSVQLLVTYVGSSEADGLIAMSTPNCTLENGSPCCVVRSNGQVNGVLTAMVEYGTTNSTTIIPDVVIDPARRTITANLTFTPAPRSGQILLVGFAYYAYPGCVLYNSNLLPALPSLNNITIGTMRAPAQ